MSNEETKNSDKTNTEDLTTFHHTVVVDLTPFDLIETPLNEQEQEEANEDVLST
jgi:hypothetical protein